jgi:hypothetical protein
MKITYACYIYTYIGICISILLSIYVCDVNVEHMYNIYNTYIIMYA